MIIRSSSPVPEPADVQCRADPVPRTHRRGDRSDTAPQLVAPSGGSWIAPAALAAAHRSPFRARPRKYCRRPNCRPQQLGGSSVGVLVPEGHHGFWSRCGAGDQLPRLRPPSTTMRWPVMNPAPSEARKLTAWAMSPGVPIRPAGTEAR